MRGLLTIACAGLLALAAPVEAATTTNPIFIRCTTQPPAHTYSVYGAYGVSNLALGDPLTQLGAEVTSPNINGFMIKFQPNSSIWIAPGAYNWAPIDQAVAQMHAAGKSFTLAPYLTGLATDYPAWLLTSGAAYVATADYHPGANCNATLNLFEPWDTVFQGYYQQFIAALAARYGNDPSLKGIKVELFNYDTGEVGWFVGTSGTVISCGGNPSFTVPDVNALFSAAGYRPALALSAYQTFLGYCQTYFPGKLCITMYLGGAGMPGVCPDGTVNANCPGTSTPSTNYETWHLDAFIPQCETQAGQLCGSAYNGFKLNYSGTPSAVSGMNAILGASQAGYFTDLQDAGLISTPASDCQGPHCVTPNGLMNGALGLPYDGWAVLKQVHNYIVQNGINMFEATGAYDVVTWNPAITDPFWRAFSVRCIQP